ncbi:MAG TPA: heavy metal translocating P-type ATPase, partial [Anaerolineae bacterium]|nr:heavy metal translocating P-type ATPase [Anaerolineae bacterium]
MAVDSVNTNRTIEETFPLSGLDCPDCALKVEKAIKKIPGVKEAAVNFTASNLSLKYDSSLSLHDTVFSRVRDFGYDVGTPEELRKSVFRIKGLDCPDCAAKLERKVSGLNGVSQAQLVFETGKLTVEHYEEISLVSDIIKAIEASGYSAELEGVRTATPKKGPFWLSDKRAKTVMVSAIPLMLGGTLQLVSGLTPASILFYITTILIAGYRPARSSISSLRSLIFDMNVLMTFAVIGAAVLGQWAEGATVMFLYAFGTMLEAYTMDKTRHAIHGLLEITPNQATVKVDDGTIKTVPVENLHIGDVVVVKPGERIPVDGKVVQGRSSVDQSAITGESLPATKDPGDEVYAGTLNHEGYIEIAISKLYRNTMLSQIIRLVEDAQARKAPSQQFIDRFSAYYTPIVISAAFAIAIIPPLLGAPFITWFYRALVLLVISCPCALVISTPVSIAAAIGAASRNGVLIKGGSHLEVAGQISSIVFDKTGTLTSGRLEVTDVIPLNGYAEDDIVRITAALESKSEHPVAEAVIAHAKSLGLT